MKLRILLLSCLCLSCFIDSSTLKSQQLFDVVSKQLDSPKKVEPPSIFGNNAEKPVQNSNNLFDTINSMNFNQMKEKTIDKVGISTKKSNTSLFSNLPKNESKVSKPKKIKSDNKKSDQKIKPQEKSYIKVGDSPNLKNENKKILKRKMKVRIVDKRLLRENKKENNKTKKTEDEIKKLKKQVKELLEMNKELLTSLKKQDKNKKTETKKKKKFDKHVVSFIQKYDNDVSSLKKNIESSKNLVENKIVKKDEEFKQLYHNTAQNFQNLQVQVNDVHAKLNNLVSEEQKKISELHSNFSIKDLTIHEKLDVDGIAFINKLNAKSIDLGNIKIDSSGINFLNENVKLIIGKDVMTVGELSNNLNSFRKLIELCGENFEKCKPVSDEIFKQQAAKQQAILDHLKILRSETTKVLTRNKRFK